MSFSIVGDRLSLTALKSTQAPFIFKLFNDPDCLNYIGDRGIHTLTDAENYLHKKLINSYRQYGFGLYQVSLKNNDEPMGICGLVKRDENKRPDIGFAFLPEFRSTGYGTEAAQAVLEWAKKNQVSDTILAYTNPENVASIRVLEKIGMVKQNITTLPGQSFESLVMSIDLSQPG